MDPLTQGALGAALPLSTRAKSQTRIAGAIGFLAGMAADLDVLIRSSSDSLLFLEYHRQFTHSLIFIPLGGLLVAAFLYLLIRWRLRVDFLRLWAFSSMGYATHGLLDAATSYGTQLLWPISDRRFSFSIISIIDPLFTLPLLFLLVVGMARKSGRWARLALLWAAAYLSFGAYQHHAAKSLAYGLAHDRGHSPVRLEVKPTFANLILWRSIYQSEGRFYADAVRPSFGAATFDGASVAKLDVAAAFPWLDPKSQQARDIQRFARFSDGFIAQATDGSAVVIDVRYAFLPTDIAPLWSIRLDAGASAMAHARYETHRENARESLGALWRMMLKAK